MTPDRAYLQSLPRGTTVPVLAEDLLDLLDAQVIPATPVMLPPDCVPWLSVPMAARYVGRSASCVSTWCWSGKLAGVKLAGGRRWSVRRSVLDAFCAQRGHNPSGVDDTPR
jgi:Helix-turn-helix domain